MAIRRRACRITFFDHTAVVVCTAKHLSSLAAGAIAELRATIRRALKHEGVEFLVIDLRHVWTMGTVAIRLLFLARKAAERRCVRVQVVGDPMNVLSVLKLRQQFAATA